MQIESRSEKIEQKDPANAQKEGPEEQSKKEEAENSKKERKSLCEKVDIVIDHYKFSSAICGCMFPFLESQFRSHYAASLCFSLFAESFACSFKHAFPMFATIRMVPLLGLTADLIKHARFRQHTGYLLALLCFSHISHAALSNRRLEKYSAAASVFFMAVFVIFGDLFFDSRKPPIGSAAEHSLYINTLKSAAFLHNILQGVFIFFGFYTIYVYLIVMSRNNIYLTGAFSALSLASGAALCVAAGLSKKESSALRKIKEALGPV